jgi:hypothetical protein
VGPTIGTTSPGARTRGRILRVPPRRVGGWKLSQSAEWDCHDPSYVVGRGALQAAAEDGQLSPVLRQRHRQAGIHRDRDVERRHPEARAPSAGRLWTSRSPAIALVVRAHVPRLRSVGFGDTLETTDANKRQVSAAVVFLTGRTFVASWNYLACPSVAKEMRMHSWMS